jgi:hypothetical protein
MKLLVALAVGLASLFGGSSVFAQQDDQRVFADTGYTIADDALWTYFNGFGGPSVFGEPISREFILQGAPTQIFQNAALQVQPDGSVAALRLADPSFLTTSQVDGLSVPTVDPATTFVTPTPDQPNYAARLQVFLGATVPEPFASAYASNGGAAVWGLPTSQPTADPNNPSFVYQRFQNGIFFFDATAGTTQPLPLGAYFKSQLQGLTLANSDLTDAFVPDAG